MKHFKNYFNLILIIFYYLLWITSQYYQQIPYFTKITTIIIKYCYFSNFALILVGFFDNIAKVL